MANDRVMLRCVCGEEKVLVSYHVDHGYARLAKRGDSITGFIERHMSHNPNWGNLHLNGEPGFTLITESQAR